MTVEYDKAFDDDDGFPPSGKLKLTSSMDLCTFGVCWTFFPLPEGGCGKVGDERALEVGNAAYAPNG